MGSPIRRPSAIEREAHLGVVSWISRGPLFIDAWWGPPTPDALRQLGEAQLEARAQRGPLGVISIIRPAVVKLPDEETRAEIRFWGDKLEPTFLSNAFLVDTPGFTSAVIRSLLAGFNAATSRGTVTKGVFSRPGEAAEFTSRQLAKLKHRVEPDAILEVIDYVAGAAG